MIDILHTDPAVEALRTPELPDPAVYTWTRHTERDIGFIQSRGLGDLFIALPIAGWYRDQGYTIHWAICEEFLPTMIKAAPWVHWKGLKTDPQGRFFYDMAIIFLKYNVLEENIINLYQFLSNRPEDSNPDLFPILKFDQYKYAQAGVPFLHKWTLGQYIARDAVAEQRVYDRVVKQDRYVVTHLTGSTAKVTLDLSAVESEGLQVIEITEGLTDTALDWLGVIEGAEALYMIDSVYSNLVDQLAIPVDKTFIRRSKMDLTPVLGQDWHYMTP
jgi:hypothetical protein